MHSLDVRGQCGPMVLDVHAQWHTHVLAVVGANGSGKSTLLKTLLGAHDVTRARLDVDGQVFWSAEQRKPIERRGFGYVPQHGVLFEHLSVVDNVAFGLLANSRGAARQEATALLSQLSCAHLAARLVGELSGGERQRVALARAVAMKPRVLLLDEPFAAMDVMVRVETRQWLVAWLKANDAVALLVTHDGRDIEAMAAEMLVLSEGTQVGCGDREQLGALPFVEALFA